LAIVLIFWLEFVKKIIVSLCSAAARAAIVSEFRKEKSASS
jgi:hypothetical protein